jgi:predicted transcriptional regulator
MQDISSKWGEKVASRGFTQIPNYLLNINMFVDDEEKLSPTEMIVLMHLIGSWWKKNEMPFPAMSTLADRIGISQRQVQRSINSLESKGLLKREKKKVKGIIASNIYNLRPLVSTLELIADTFKNQYPRNIKKPGESNKN